MRKALLALAFAFAALPARADSVARELYKWNLSFENGRKAQVLFEYQWADNSAFDNVKRFEFGVLFYKRFLRHGPTYVFGWKDFSSKGIRQLEADYNFIIQLPYWGVRRQFLSVSRMFSVVPFAGAVVGVGLHTDDFPKPYKFSDTGDWLKDGVENYVVARLRAGADIVINPGLAVEISASKALTMEKGFTLEAGLNLDF